MEDQQAGNRSSAGSSAAGSSAAGSSATGLSATQEKRSDSSESGGLGSADSTRIDLGKTQATEGKSSERELAGEQTLAFTGGLPITAAEVDFQLGRTGVVKTALREMEPAALQQAIYLVARQRQALQRLRELGMAVEEQELQGWVKQQVDRQPNFAGPPERWLQSQATLLGISQEAFLEVIAFRLSWAAYLQRIMTDENLRKHFVNQSERFNGTQFRIEVASIAVPAGSGPKREAALERLKAALADGELPTGDGVEVLPPCWIRGMGDLPHELVTAILNMEPQELSKPIHSAAGVHLIRLLEKRIGQRTFEQARDEVRSHLLIFLLDFLANQSREKLPLRAAND